MEKILLVLVFAFSIMSCEKEALNKTQDETSFEIEGKWLLANAGGSELLPNTMWEFRNGIMYTYYCTDGANCDWSGMSLDDAIPNQPSYTFEDNTFTIDNIVRIIGFECNGEVINVIDQEWKWWRIGTDPDNCN